MAGTANSVNITAANIANLLPGFLDYAREQEMGNLFSQNRPRSTEQSAVSASRPGPYPFAGVHVPVAPNVASPAPSPRSTEQSAVSASWPGPNPFAGVRVPVAPNVASPAPSPRSTEQSAVSASWSGPNPFAGVRVPVAPNVASPAPSPLFFQQRAPPAPAMRAAFGRSRKRRRVISSTKKTPSGPFFREVVLLPGPTTTTVPRQGIKVWLASKGQVKNCVQLLKEHSANQVRDTLRASMGDKLPLHVSVEICQAMCTTVTPIMLAPGQDLDGVILSKSVRHDKIIYLRPDTRLPGMSSMFPTPAEGDVDGDGDLVDVFKGDYASQSTYVPSVSSIVPDQQSSNGTASTATWTYVPTASSIVPDQQSSNGTASTATIEISVEQGTEVVQEVQDNNTTNATWTHVPTASSIVPDQQSSNGTASTATIEISVEQGTEVVQEVQDNNTTNATSMEIPVEQGTEVVQEVQDAATIEISVEQGTEVTEVQEVQDNSATNGHNAVSFEVPKGEHRSDVLLFDIIEALHRQIHPYDTENRVSVHRDDVWGMAKINFRRKKFNPCAPLRIDFFNFGENSEGAVDQGGPTKELFTLCMEGMMQGKCFIGEEMKLLTRDSTALQKKDYEVCGRVIALSLVHGGPAPHFLAPVLYDGITTGPDNTHVAISDLPACEVKASMVELKDMKEPAEFLTALDEPEHKALATTIDNGGTMGMLSKGEEILPCLERTAKYYIFGRTADALNQFQSGLSTLGVLEAMKQHPLVFRKLFTIRQEPLSLPVMLALFHYTRSTGDKEYAVEGRVLCHWQTFLHKVADGECELDGEECDLKFEDILQFATGLKNLPPTGFPPGKPSIEFLHTRGLSKCKTKMPKANTCTQTLQLPTVNIDYDSFEVSMISAFKWTNGFGYA